MVTTDRKQQLIQTQEQVRDGIGALLSRTSDAQLDARTPTGWTVRRTLFHLAGTPTAHLFVISRLKKGRAAKFPRWLLNSLNFVNGLRAGKPDRAKIQTRLATDHEKMAAAIGALSDQELDARADALDRGPQSVYEYLMQVPDHLTEHGPQIGAALRK
jgi:uncharacterized damage-inducible protein DinB